MKKIKLLVVFCLLMVLSLSVFAKPGAVDASDTVTEVEEVDEDVTLFGDGSVSLPFTISSTGDFNYYAKIVNKAGSVYADKNFKLTSNIDFSGVELVPFGTESSPFKGNFDGNGYAIKNVSIADNFQFGVIGKMTRGSISNLAVEYTDMSEAKELSTLKYYGGIVADVNVEKGKVASITNCSVSGDLIVKSQTALYFGGIAGQIYSTEGNCYITNCVSTQSIDISSAKTSYIGGMVAHTSSGNSESNAMYKNCISYGNVSCNLSNEVANIAGFAGYFKEDVDSFSGWASDDGTAELSASAQLFENCFAFGNVTCSAKKVYYGDFLGRVLLDKEANIEYSNCFVPSSQVITINSPEKEVYTFAQKKSEQELRDEQFLSSCGFDFDDEWYQSDGSLKIRKTAKSNGGVTLLDDATVRLNENKSGLRFSATIEVPKRDYCYEYGFIFGREDVLNGEELTFNSESVHGAAYNVENGTDIFFDKDDEIVSFTGVLYNIKQPHYATNIICRAYLKYKDESGDVIIYGNPVTASINSAAQYVKDTSYNSLSDAQKAMLETMLP